MKFALLVVLAFCAAMVSGMPHAQDYPNKPIRMIAPEAGSGADLLARMVAQALGAGVRQQVIVENRGGNIVVPVELVVNAAPDGYTILFFSSAVWVAPFLQNVRFDPVRDLSPVTLAVSSPNILAVHPSVPAKTVAELISLAKRKPGELNYAAGGFGSANHLSGELFKSMAGVNLTYVPYKGSPSALAATLGGEVSVIVTTVSSILPLMKSGRLRTLAITSAQPSDLAPGLPTVAATVPGYEASVKLAVFAPARTPATVIDRLNAEITRYVKSAQAKEQLLKAGADAVGNSSQDLAALMKADMAIMSKVIKEAGIKAN